MLFRSEGKRSFCSSSRGREWPRRVSLGKDGAERDARLQGGEPDEHDRQKIEGEMEPFPVKRVVFGRHMVILAQGGILCPMGIRADKAAEFLAGRAFSILPDGFWRGDTYLPKGNWLGKRFSADRASGMNVFAGKSGQLASYPFKMYTAPALGNPGHTVTCIDYNVPENPWYLRRALDEVVEVAPGKLVGKIHFRFSRTFSITLGYFWQNRE